MPRLDYTSAPQFPKFIQKIENGQLAKGLPFIRFGKGPQKLVIFPGISDAFLPIASSMPQYIPGIIAAMPVIMMFASSAGSGDCRRIYTRDMARDYAAAIEEMAARSCAGPFYGLFDRAVSSGRFPSSYPRPHPFHVLFAEGSGDGETCPPLDNSCPSGKMERTLRRVGECGFYRMSPRALAPCDASAHRRSRNSQ